MTGIARRWVRSYRVRLGLGYLLVVAVVAGAWAWSLFGPLTGAVIREQQTQLQSVAQAGALLLGESDEPPQQVAERLVARTNLRVTVVDSGGAVLADTQEDPAGMENHGHRPEVRTALEGGVGRDRRVSATEGTEQLYVAVPAGIGGERGVLRVAVPLERIKETAAAARRTAITLLGVVIVVSLVVADRVVSLATAPVVRLARSAHAMARGDLSANVPAAEGELEMLSTALVELRDQMRARMGQLETEKRNLRSVLDGLQDAVLLLEDGAVRLANTAAERMFREPSGGWRGAALADVLPASLAATVAGLAERGAASSEECGADASGRYLRVTVLPLHASGTRRRTLVVVADVTERARLDEVRRDFVANASHELKTPTAGIQLLAESAAHAAEDGDSRQALAFVSQMKEEAARLRRLVLDLLDLSRLETETASGEVTDVRHAVGLAVTGHSAAAGRLGLTLDVRDDAQGEDLFVTADATDVAVALDNLLDNAVKYTERGGVTVTLSADEGTGSAVIAVADSGIGIPPEDLPRIFERFYRVDRARSREGGGTGLGLSLVRHVVERSGGSLEVSSVVGEGSVFTLRLPLATRRPAA